MKLFVLSLVLVVFLTRCCSDKGINEKKDNNSYRIERGCITIINIDSCEYILWDWGSAQGNIIHKQNCKFCIERKTK